MGLGYDTVQVDQSQATVSEPPESSTVVAKGKGRKKPGQTLQDLASLCPELQNYLKSDYYVNVELEVWRELRQSIDQVSCSSYHSVMSSTVAGQQQSDRTVAVDMQYQVGDVCEVS